MIRAGLFSALFLTFASFVIWIAAGAFSAAQERQVIYRYVESALAPSGERIELVKWQEPAKELARPFSQIDAEFIGRALGEAWQIFAIAQETGDTNLVADRFTGVAETRAVQAVIDGTKFGGRQVVLSQTATPNFFHKDGSLFQADVEMVVARYLSDDGQSLNAYTISKETGVATLINDSEGWRLYSYERRSSKELTADSVFWSGTLNGINYYPTDTPWRDFWPEFDTETIAADFDRVLGLGADAVRVFLTRDAFLGDDYKRNLENLNQLLLLAEKKAIQVMPTLFDLKQDFSLGTWAEDAIYLERVLPVLQASSAVAFVDLKNEPDLDFEHQGTAKITAWLQSIEAMTRRVAPNLPLTIGWASADYANVMLSHLDVITYHDYAPIEGATDRLAEVRKIAGTKPVLVTEIGETTYQLSFSFPGSPKQQVDNLEKRLQALDSADGVFIWTLYDFQKVDATVVGDSPWVQRLQSSFGVFKADGTEKPVAKIIRDRFSGRP